MPDGGVCNHTSFVVYCKLKCNMWIMLTCNKTMCCLMISNNSNNYLNNNFNLKRSHHHSNINNNLSKVP